MIFSIYKSTSDTVKGRFSQDLQDGNGQQPFDFTATTRIVVEFEGFSEVADSAVDAALFDWSAGDGSVDFAFNAVPVKSYDTVWATMRIYDGLHPNGQVLAHAKDRMLGFRFIEESIPHAARIVDPSASGTDRHIHESGEKWLYAADYSESIHGTGMTVDSVVWATSGDATISNERIEGPVALAAIQTPTKGQQTITASATIGADVIDVATFILNTK